MGYEAVVNFDAGDVKGKVGQKVECSKERAEELLKKGLIKAVDSKPAADEKSEEHAADKGKSKGKKG